MLRPDDVDFKRPGTGIGPDELRYVVGRSLTRDVGFDEETRVERISPEPSRRQRGGAAVKLVFFGDGAWAANSLRPLREDGHEIVGVVVRRTPSSTELAETARALGLPVYQPRECQCGGVRRVRPAVTPRT